MGPMRVQALLGAGCKSTVVAGKWGVSCPRMKSDAFTCNSQEDALHGAPSYDFPYIYVAADPTNITAIGKWDKFQVFQVNHALTEDKDKGQLSCQTTYELGDDSWVGKALNTVTMRKTLAANMGGNIEQTLPFYAVHEVQKFGFYPQWRPAVYNTYANVQP